MGLFTSNCIIIEDTYQINISRLKMWGYIKPSSSKAGNIVWSDEGQEVAKISIFVNTYDGHSYMDLSYIYNKGEERNYKVQITYRPSNLGHGQVPYFICPNSGKLCRKLYCIDGWFFSRHAFKNCYYKKQTYSTHSRALFKIFDKVCPPQKIYSDRYRKYRKTHYAGNPTKWYKKFLEQTENIDPYKAERLLVFGKV